MITSNFIAYERKIVGFDFDGVILDSNHAKHNSFLKVFENYKQFEEIRMYQERNESLSRYEKIHYIVINILKSENPKLEVEKLLSLFKQECSKSVSNCEFVPDAIKLLEHLKKKVHIYLISATPQSDLAEILRERKIDNVFQGVYGSPISKADAFNEIIKLERIKSNNFIYIGDSLTDLHSSLSVGATFIGKFSGTPFPENILTFNTMLEVRDYLDRVL